jgi:hypothetical protein
MKPLIKNAYKISIINFFAQKINLICFVLSIHMVFSLGSCIPNKCNIPEIIQNNKPLLETLLNEIIYQKSNLSRDFKGYYPNTIKFDIDKFVNENNRTQDEFVIDNCTIQG